MKPKAGDFIGEGPDVEVPKPRTDGFYVQFPEEPLQVAIDSHDGEPFNSIEECMEFVGISGEEPGRTFNVVDIDGRIHMTGMVTHDGVEEIDASSIRGR